MKSELLEIEMISHLAKYNWRYKFGFLSAAWNGKQKKSINWIEVLNTEIVLPKKIFYNLWHTCSCDLTAVQLVYISLHSICLPGKTLLSVAAEPPEWLVGGRASDDPLS